MCEGKPKGNPEGNPKLVTAAVVVTIATAADAFNHLFNKDPSKRPYDQTQNEKDEKGRDMGKEFFSNPNEDKNTRSYRLNDFESVVGKHIKKTDPDAWENADKKQKEGYEKYRLQRWKAYLVEEYDKKHERQEDGDIY